MEQPLAVWHQRWQVWWREGHGRAGQERPGHRPGVRGEGSERCVGLWLIACCCVDHIVNCRSVAASPARGSHENKMESERGLFLFPHPLPLVVSANVALLMHLQLACGMPQKRTRQHSLAAKRHKPKQCKANPKPKAKNRKKGKDWGCGKGWGAKPSP